MKNYNVYKISSVPFLPDILSGLLWELEITGVTENDDIVIAFAAEDSPVNEEMINGLLNKLAAQNVIGEFSVTREILEEKNWNEEISEFQVPFQSELTHLAAEEILEGGACKLTRFNESSLLHQPFLEAIKKHIETVEHRKYDYCPIT